MIELLWIAFRASLIGLIAPLGIGWLWKAALTREGTTEPSFGMIYWLGLMSLGAMVLFGHAFELSQTLVVVLVGCASASGWIWSLLRTRRGTGGALRTAWPLLPLALIGIAYCVLDPVRVWDAYLIWLARVRLLEEWIPLSRFRDLRIVYAGYPFLGAAAWWWTDRAAQVPVEAGRVVFLFAYLAFFLAVLAREPAAGGIRFRLLWVFFAYAGFSLQIVDGYQDGFLMVSAGMVALAFLQWGDRGATWIPPVAAGLSLIKAEGAVLGLILVFCWFLSQPSLLPALHRNGVSRRALLVGGLGFALMLAAWPWLTVRSGLDPADVQGDAFRIRSIGVFLSQADRIPKILWEIAHQYTLNAWISIPFLAAVVSAPIRGETLERGRRFLLGFVILHVLFVFTVFWVTQEPFEWHLGTALHRLLLQGRFVMMIFVFETASRQWAPFLAHSTPRQEVQLSGGPHGFASP